MSSYDHDLTGPLESRRGEAKPDRSDAEPRAVVPAQATAVFRLQREAGNASVAQLLADGDEQSPVAEVLASGRDQPLDASTRVLMEGTLGQDFSDVRIHTDQAASDSAASLGARAFTVGNHVVFQSGAYQPSTPVGQRTLAHELTHVVQQRSGPVDGAPGPGGIQVSDPGDRFEREAERVADTFSAPTAEAAPPGIQRQVEEEPEDELQMLPLQRQEAEEEEME